MTTRPIDVERTRIPRPAGRRPAALGPVAWGLALLMGPWAGAQVMLRDGAAGESLDPAEVHKAMPSMDMEGLGEMVGEPVEELSEEEAELELQDLLEPGAKDRAQVAAFEKDNSIWQIVKGEHLKDKNGDFYWDARCQAAKDLGKYVDDPKVVDLLWDYGVVRYSPNPDFRPACINSFMRTGTNALPRILRTLDEARRWNTRSTMISLLWGHRNLAPELCRSRVLEQFRKDPSEDVRGIIMNLVFGQKGSGGDGEDIEELAKWIVYNEENTKSKYMIVWNRYVQADRNAQTPLPPHLPLWRDVLKRGRTWENRWFALEALRLYRDTYGDRWTTLDAEAAPDVVRALLEDPDGKVRHAAVDCLYAFEAPAAVTALAQAVTDDADPDVRAYAARVLGLKVAPVVPLPWMDRWPEEAQAHRERRDRERTAAAGAPTAAAIAALRKALHDPDPFVCLEAVTALGRMGGDDALAALRAFPAHSESWINDAVAQTLRAAEDQP